MYTYLCPYLLIKLISGCYELYFREQKNTQVGGLNGTVCCSIDQSVVVCVDVHERRERSLTPSKIQHTQRKYFLFSFQMIYLSTPLLLPPWIRPRFLPNTCVLLFNALVAPFTSCNIGVPKIIPKNLFANPSYSTGFFNIFIYNVYTFPWQNRS